MNLLTGAPLQEILSHQKVLTVANRGGVATFAPASNIVGNVQPKRTYNAATQKYENGFILYTADSVTIGAKVTSEHGAHIILQKMYDNEYLLK